VRIPSFTILNFYMVKGHDKNENSDRIRVISSLENLSKHQWIFLHFSEALCTKRLKSGCRLYYMLDDNSNPCCFAWYKTGTHHFVGEINRIVVYPKVVNCIFDCLTPEGFRGRGFYSKLIKWVVNENSDHVCIIYAATNNNPSNKGILKSGFKPTHKIFRFFKFVKIIPASSDQLNIYVQA